MALTFNPPEWLIREYMNRKRPVDELADTLNSISTQNLQQRRQDQAMELQRQEAAQRQQQIDMAGRQIDQKGIEQAYNTGSPAFLPQGMQQELTAPVQGPTTETGAPPARTLSPIVANFADFMKANPGGYKGAESAKDLASADLEKAKAEAIRKGAPPSGAGAKPQLRMNQFTGEYEWYTPPAPGAAPMTSPTPTGNNGPRIPFKERAKLEADARESSATVEPVLAEVDRVMKLNDNSYGGALGAMEMKAKSALNMGKNDPKFQNTADVINTMQGAVSRILKSTFGAQLSDSEREYLNTVYGAVPKMSTEERRIAMGNVKKILTAKPQAARAKAGMGQQQGAATGGGGAIPTIADDAAFNALPSGSQFKDPQGQIHRKK
jgi:hypothetical protein